MKTFDYVVKDELGIHARPAGLLVKEVKNYKSKVLLKKDDTEIDATRLMAIMALGVKCGTKVTLTIEGEDEEEACQALQQFFEEQL
ncbi:MAG: HPr family phosphocarrier protein [Clostridiales bacterium]|nr:HPr family phosphocarrier protein [Roseburia sp.]MDD7635720.1 HPr family phosphocarrier protein [Clostridiales bacterium]MDY4111522.1 HPr family phosphocarrier protein [Roseburia sp.]